MAITLVTSATLSDLLPGLKDAAAALQEKNDEVTSFLADKQKGVDGMAARVASFQNELSRAQDAAANAQDILNSANQILEEAKGLTTNITDALNTSGIYLYNYVGYAGNFGNEFATELGTGGIAGGANFESNEAMVALVFVVGSDGGTTATISRINALAGQIGGNAQAIVDLYTPIAPAP